MLRSDPDWPTMSASGLVLLVGDAPTVIRADPGSLLAIIAAAALAATIVAVAGGEECSSQSWFWSCSSVW
jgi:hypothetical protein